MDLRDFRAYVDNLVRTIEPGTVLNYFRTKRLYARRRFYRVRVETLVGSTTVKAVRKEFERQWLILGAGTESSKSKRPQYTACLKIGNLPARQFRALRGDKGAFSLDLRGCVGWTVGDKPIRDVIKKNKGLRMTEEQKAKRFIECVLARAHCSEEEAMELWASTKTATLSKLKNKLKKKK
jgi:hypothetical protein